jgi:hypothetical protein
MPENLPKDVDAFLAFAGWTEDADRPFVFQEADPSK